MGIGRVTTGTQIKKEAKGKTKMVGNRPCVWEVGQASIAGVE